MSNTSIEWTDKVWNPVTGCEKISQGCKHCYAKEVHDKRHKAFSEGKLQNVKQYASPFEKVLIHPNRLTIPFSWKQPARIFVNSMSDLFHDDVPFQFIIDVFLTMKQTPQHTYQILTKRPARMLEFFTECAYNPFGNLFQPLPNVWLGVSVENKQAAYERIPLLLQAPAAVRFLSCEPLLEAIFITRMGSVFMPFNALTGEVYETGSRKIVSNLNNKIDWVICGGESGSKARPMHPEWARSLRDQCNTANVPFFFKQWGEYVSVSEVAGKGDHYKFPDGATVRKLGKKKAGRLIDGKEWNQFPITNKNKHTL